MHTPAREHLPRNNRKKGPTINDMKFRCRFNATRTRKTDRAERKRGPVAGDIIKLPYGPINSDQPTGIPEDPLEISARWVQSPPVDATPLFPACIAYPS